MARFQLVPPEVKPAIQQLWDCAAMATSVIMRSHGWYGLYRDYRDEVFGEIVYETVKHFLEFRVRRHTYRRQANDGRPLNFADNVISSCYGVASRVVDVFMKRLTRLNETADIEPIKFCLGNADRLPTYVNDQEYHRRRYNRKLERPSDRARAVRREYELYLEDFHDMGLSGEPLELGPWLTRNGYTDDDLFLYMESKDARKRLLKGQARWIFETKQAQRDSLIKNNSVLHAQIYNRIWKRQRRHEEWKRRSLEFEKLFGPPPEGHIWKERRGVVGLYKLKEEDK